MENLHEINQDFEIDINDITTTEYIDFKTDFDKYKKDVSFFLKKSKKLYSQNELLQQYKTKDFEKFLKTSPLIYSFSSDLNDKDFKNYADLAESYIVMPNELIYDSFFSYKLRHLSIFKIHDFLDYQNNKYYEGDLIIFKKFLNNCLKANSNKVKPEWTESVHEWIAEKELENIAKPTREKTKTRPKRISNDKRTSLTQEQTVLLIHNLREQKVFFDSSYLTNKEIAEAIEVLTGYSIDTIRQDLGKIEPCKSQENVKSVIKLLSTVIKSLENDLPKAKVK